MLQGTSANHLTTVQPNVTAISNHFMINYMNLVDKIDDFECILELN